MYILMKFGQRFIVSQWYFNALSKTFEEIDKAYIQYTKAYMQYTIISMYQIY